MLNQTLAPQPREQVQNVDRYNRLCELLRRPQGCSVAEAARELGVTPGGCRGMIRDLKDLLPVETVYSKHLGRGKGRQAIHFVRQSDQVSVKPLAR